MHRCERAQTGQQLAYVIVLATRRMHNYILPVVSFSLLFRNTHGQVDVAHWFIEIDVLDKKTF